MLYNIWLLASKVMMLSETRNVFYWMSTFKAIKSHLKQSYDKQNLTLMIIAYEIYETRQRLIS